MIDAFTAQELSILRSQPQNHILKMTAFRPAVVWTGRLVTSQPKGERGLIVTTLTGSISNILPGTTLVIGEGVTQDRLRIRSASGGLINVAENAVDWDTTLTLKALLYFEPHVIYSRIENATKKQGGRSNFIINFYEDYDIPYTDQNEIFQPVVNIGPAVYVLELDCESSGTHVDLNISSLDSFVYDNASISSHQWNLYTGAGDAFDAEIIGSSVASSCVFRFWDVGDYYISCTITTNTGKTSTGYRPVMVRCSTPGHSYSPFTNIKITSLEGSRETGYWNASITIFEDCDETILPRNVPIVLYTTGAYGQGVNRTTEHVPWYYSNTAHQRFVGWVKGEEWALDHRGNGIPVTLEAVGINGVLDTKSGYSAWLKFANNPSDWTDYLFLTAEGMLYFYLRNRTNLLNITDWHPTGTPNFTHYAEIAEGKVFSNLKQFLEGSSFVELISDRSSAIWSEFHGNSLSDSLRSTKVRKMLDLTVNDRMDEFHIPVTQDKPPVSWLSLDGLYHNGADDIPYISYAPGYVIDTSGGDVERTSGLIVAGTASELNELTGRIFSMRNNPLTEIPFATPGMYPYDIAPQTSIGYSQSSGTFREESIADGAEFLIRTVSDRYNEGNKSITSDVTVDAIVRDYNANVGRNIPKAVRGVEGLFPPTDEVVGVDPDQFSLDWDNYENDWPDFSDTSIPSDTSVASPILSLTDSPGMYVASQTGIGRTATPTGGSPNYILITNSLTGEIKHMILDPWAFNDRMYVTTVTAPKTVRLYEILGITGSSFTVNLLLTYTDPQSKTIIDAFPYASINQRGFIGIGIFGNDGQDRFIRRTSYTGAFNVINMGVADNNVPGCGGFEPNSITSISIENYAPSINDMSIYAIGPIFIDCAGDIEQFYRSTDGGQTWSILSQPTGLDRGAMTGCIIQPYANNNHADPNVYVFSWSFHTAGGSPFVGPQSLVRKRKNGVWSNVAAPVGDGTYYALVQGGYQAGMGANVYTQDDRILAYVSSSFVHRSNDGGANWYNRSLPSTGAIALWGWPNNPNTFLACRFDQQHLYWTINDCVTWNDCIGNFFSVVGGTGVVQAVPIWINI